ncbi:RHS repeat domain-containing protein [Pseudoxanthomonas sp. UC19_8]|uniref:RHS repeat domain-containing protein n=1 Tax=Pseudoxanthomonas sp. UC19_8 TaxID=3350175 RepID=UPI0036D38F04
MKTGVRVFLAIWFWIQLSGIASAQTVEYIHTDALGTPIAVTDASGNVVERSEYAPYGALLNRPAQDGPGFTGHVQDSNTGLNYMQQRYYDPMLGIFYSRDPITALKEPFEQFNAYRYANNNPYKFTDPDGRSVTCDETRCVGVSHSLGEAIIDTIHVQAVYFSRLM